jgi:hypothetical protein
MFDELVKPPLEAGDNGNPLTVPAADGDLERRSDVRRSCGIEPVYRSRVVSGDAGCGSAGERDATGGFLDTSTTLADKCITKEKQNTYSEFKRGLISGTENKVELGGK